jgi:hypothetical protein
MDALFGRVDRLDHRVQMLIGGALRQGRSARSVPHNLPQNGTHHSRRSRDSSRRSPQERCLHDVTASKQRAHDPDETVSAEIVVSTL